MTAAGRPAGDRLSIGAVLSRLREEFPDVTISKIRFLEAEGLVQPARTASGYRQFTAADVDRLRFVLAAQRDHYLPLRVIKEQLDAADSAERPRVLRAVPADGLPAAEDFAEQPIRRMTREELIESAGIDPATLSELEQYGLVKPGAAGLYDNESAQVAAIVHALADFGVEPRHLRGFRAAADREVGLVEQIVAPMRGRKADEAVRELAALSVGLHTMLVKAGLRRIAGK
ncbi:transcriptional regulator FtsR [Actinophytocola algeriensis]|uniref:DNA-binding transcriptional MerR regulator n=1 Tax=Actinophytocola algeriensis TaxID=1768010 RepID=A0A7W7VJD3_9PSEU|nr:MerR family transcriptional regulator [Actinophytocola algeriensis]MBB4912436.1 DNA-binding transcriptional MerR regulator [Actinophytocola algeriensis]MBE1480991.1 DNA-binding transcriptional MerR regulator [Actinophytocola algeriensis]